MQHEAVISFSAVLIHLPKVLTYEQLKLNFKTLTKFSAFVFKAQLGLCLPLALPKTSSWLNALLSGFVWQNEYTLYYCNHLGLPQLNKKKARLNSAVRDREKQHFNIQKVFPPGVWLKAAFDKVCCISELFRLNMFVT